MATRRSRRSVTVFTLLLLTALTLVALGSSGTASSVVSGLRSIGSTVLSPVVSAVNTITRPIGHVFQGVVNYGSVVSENDQLRAENARLRLSGQVQAYERHSLAQIGALRGLSFVGSLPTVVAQTTAVYSSNFAATIVISRGRNDGVGVGMPVVGAGGLVGQVVQTSRTSATVRLVTDGRTRIGASVGTSSVLGIVAGQAAQRPLILNYVAPQSAVHVGDVVVTDGLQGAAYPAGIPVGKVSSAFSPPNSTQMSISLTPMANLDQLAYVDVILWSPPL